MNFFDSRTYQTDEGFRADLRERLRCTKVVHLRVPEAADDLLAFHAALLADLGHVDLRGEDLSEKRFYSGDWLDIRYDAERAESFRHSNTRQPLHTDGSYIDAFDYDMVVLVCARAARHGGATHFLDADLLVALLEEEQPDLLAGLREAPVKFSKGPMGTLTRKIIDRDDEGWLLNWNAFRVSDDNPDEVRDMAGALHRFLEQRVIDSGLATAVHLQAGDAAFFNDRRVLHGRNAFFGERCLYKATLSF